MTPSPQQPTEVPTGPPRHEAGVSRQHCADYEKTFRENANWPQGTMSEQRQEETSSARGFAQRGARSETSGTVVTQVGHKQRRAMGPRHSVGEWPALWSLREQRGPPTAAVSGAPQPGVTAGVRTASTAGVTTALRKPRGPGSPRCCEWH